MGGQLEISLSLKKNKAKRGFAEETRIARLRKKEGEKSGMRGLGKVPHSANERERERERAKGAGSRV